MPAEPQPIWRDSSWPSQSVSDPLLEMLMVLPLRSSAVLIGEILRHREHDRIGRVGHGGDADLRRALGDEGELRPGADADIDRTPPRAPAARGGRRRS